MDNLLLRTLVSAASFALTVFVFVVLVRQAKQEYRTFWFIACSIATVVWLGIIKGPVAVLLAIALSTGYVATRLDARKIGKKVADSIGMNRSLFFTCLENSLPLYLVALAELQRKRTTVANARAMLLPHVADGLLVLENRFGRQEMIDAAKLRVLPLLAELENA
jgi:hypothetical protein